MANITKPAKVTDADLSGEVTETEAVTVTVNEPAEAFSLDNEQVRLVMSKLRWRLNTYVQDAKRSRPVLSASKAEAEAKARALFIVLKETAEQAV